MFGTDWQAWHENWDRQQEWYVPDREVRFQILLDQVEQAVGPQPRVLDLACGLGSLTDRLLRRFPGARCTGVDLDPVLLTIARGRFMEDSRAAFVSADLRDEAWLSKLPAHDYDAVLTATSMHWLSTDELRVLYQQLTRLVRRGGVFLNSDHMPSSGTPRLNILQESHHEKRRAQLRSAGVLDWPGWWQMVAKDETLGEFAEERFRMLGDPSAPGGDHSDEELPTPAWHVAELRSAGFLEAASLWASFTDAVVVAMR
ncbi:class I SAM-dependent methyltransferase [Streptomyces sp. BA2]|uniref:class I SAM-dependent methyltransferase n=1 Tax=Streptomyces sp. BA2 TaxID=436595 RepID=UPI00132700BB|nr:class I SAM-dependent methyltransferase [Streptomyces sp. BA2]MWA07859.1 methyltransferase domain-containing protein [Streptomyces sp. BA2]